MLYGPIAIAAALTRRRLFSNYGCGTVGTAQLPEQLDELVEHARCRAPDAMAIVGEGGNEHLPPLMFPHLEFHVALVHKVGQRYLNNLRDLMIADCIGVFGLRGKHPDVRRHPEIAYRHHVVKLTDDPDVFWLYAYLLEGLAKSRCFKAVVGFVAGAAGERNLSLVMLDVGCAFREDDVRFTFAVADKYEDSGGRRFGVLYVTRSVLRDGVQDAIRSFFGTHD